MAEDKTENQELTEEQEPAEEPTESIEEQGSTEEVVLESEVAEEPVASPIDEDGSRRGPGTDRLPPAARAKSGSGWSSRMRRRRP